MIESYIPGHEVTVSILGTQRGPAPLVLPAVEIIAPGGFYDFAAKYEKGEDAESLPRSPSAASVTKQIRALALRTGQ